MTLSVGKCTKSLEANDFNRYDVVPDKKLHRNEMTDEQFKCFISQLLHTTDRDVLTQFVDAIQNDMWESIRSALVKIDIKTIPAPLKPIVSRLLHYDFSDRNVKGEVTGSYFTLGLWANINLQGARSKERYAVHQFKGVGVLDINVPFRQWRLKSRTSIAGSETLGEIGQTQSDPNGSITNKIKLNYPGVTADTALEVMKRNSKFYLNLKAGLDKYWNPLADQLSSGARLGGLLNLRNIFDSKFSLKASTDWKNNSYADPINPALNSRKENNITSNVEASYLFNKAGAVVTYDFENNDTVPSFYHESKQKHLPSALVHVPLQSGYIRVGGGGGSWHKSLKLLGESNVTNVESSEVHGRFEMLLSPKKWLDIKLNADGYANYSKGDFNGWFPGWLGSAEIAFRPGQFVINLSANVEGNRKDLEKKQTFNTGWVESSLMYRARDRFRLMLLAAYIFSKQSGYQSYSEQAVKLGSVIGGRLIRKPDLWLEFQGMYRNTRYDQQDMTRKQHEVGAQLFVNIKF